MKRRNFLIKTGLGVSIAAGLGVSSCGPIRRILAKQVDETTLPYDNDADENIWFQIMADNTCILHSPKVEMGQGIFTALAQIAAEELDVDWTNIKVVHASTEHGPIDAMSTGGSLTVSGLFEPLSQLAANMRELLKVNAAKTFKWPLEQIKTDAGFLIYGNQKKSYGELVAGITKWDTGFKEPKLKDKKDYKYVGKPLPRVDLLEKITGKPLYGIDADFKDMVYASVLRPPAFGAKIGAIDDSEAKKTPTFIKLVQDKDLVATVAGSKYWADAAKNALKVDWIMPAKLVQQEDVNKLIGVEKGKKIVIQKEGGRLSDIDEVFTQNYESPMGAHGHIEPNGAVAFFTPDKLTIKLSTQVAKMTRFQVAEALNISEDKIDIQAQYLGGGFGRRLLTSHAIDAARISKVLGKPVHVFFERREEFQNGFLRPPCKNKLSATVQNKKITHLEHQTASADVAFHSPLLPFFVKPLTGPMAQGLLGADFGAWRGGMLLYHGIPNYSTTAYHNTLPFQTSWWRGLGLMANTFAIESFFDELAINYKIDALKLRLEHLADDESGNAMKGVLNVVAKMADWGRKMPEGTGLGLACSTDVTVPVAQIAEVSVIDGIIKVKKVYCAIDPGFVVNPDGVKAQCEGAINMGLSSALFEEILIKDGKATPDNYAAYGISTIKDAPEIETVILSTGEKPKGIGEPPIGPIAAAIANAVYAATGKRLRKMPLQEELNKQLV